MVSSELGRYESPALSLGEVEEFLARYAPFLEGDGRHHLWIASRDNDGLLVYDNRNITYAYGALDRIVPALISREMSEAAEIRFPVPHHHYYNSEFDKEEESIVKALPWSVVAQFRKYVPQGLKPLSFLQRFTARLKPCPFKAGPN